MIGVIVVGTRRQYNIRIPLADLPDHLLAHLERGQQLSVVIIEDCVLDAQTARRFLGLGEPALGKSGAVQCLMARIAVGDGHELHRVPGGGKERGGTRRADVAIVGMRAEGDDPNLFSLRQQGRDAGQHQYETSHDPQILPHIIMRTRRRRPVPQPTLVG